MHSNPSQSQTQAAHHGGKASLKRKVFFTCLQKESQDGARLASSGREFHSLGAATEKALSCVPTKGTCEGGGTKRKALPDVFNTDLNTHRDALILCS